MSDKKGAHLDTMARKIKEGVSKLPADCDMGDLGNEIGVVIGKYLDYEDKMGWSYKDFLRGLGHGISIADGTHPREELKK